MKVNVKSVQCNEVSILSDLTGTSCNWWNMMKPSKIWFHLPRKPGSIDRSNGRIDRQSAAWATGSGSTASKERIMLRKYSYDQGTLFHGEIDLWPTIWWIWTSQKHGICQNKRRLISKKYGHIQRKLFSSWYLERPLPWESLCRCLSVADML